MYEFLIKLLTNAVDALVKQGISDAASRKRRAAKELYFVFQLLRRFQLSLTKVADDLNPVYAPGYICASVYRYVKDITQTMRELFLVFDDTQFSSLRVSSPEASEFFRDVMKTSHVRLKELAGKPNFDLRKLEIFDRDLFDLLNIVYDVDIDIWFYLNAISLIDRDSDKFYVYRLSDFGSLERLFQSFPGIVMMVRRGLTETPPLDIPEDYPYEAVRSEFLKDPSDGTLRIVDLTKPDDVEYIRDMISEHARLVQAARDKLGDFIKEHFTIDDLM